MRTACDVPKRSSLTVTRPRGKNEAHAAGFLFPPSFRWGRVPCNSGSRVLKNARVACVTELCDCADVLFPGVRRFRAHANQQFHIQILGFGAGGDCRMNAPPLARIGGATAPNVCGEGAHAVSVVGERRWRVVVSAGSVA